VVLAGGVLMTLNGLKFGSPFDTGYQYIYDGGREDEYGQRCRQYGLFSLHFVPENAYYMNLSPPRYRDSPALIQQDNHSDGVSIWMTSPLLLGVPLGIRLWWRNPAARALVCVSLVVIFAILMYHAPGSPQVGYFRYGLDFVPIWLVLAAPWWNGSARRRTVVFACLAWSALHFHMLLIN
jgi:hypothetical protein